MSPSENGLLWSITATISFVFLETVEDGVAGPEVRGKYVDLPQNRAIRAVWWLNPFQNQRESGALSRPAACVFAVRLPQSEPRFLSGKAWRVERAEKE